MIGKEAQITTAVNVLDVRELMEVKVKLLAIPPVDPRGLRAADRERTDGPFGRAAGRGGRIPTLAACRGIDVSKCGYRRRRLVAGILDMRVLGILACRNATE